MMMKGWGGKGGWMGGKGMMGNNNKVKGDPKTMVYVGNLPYKVRWQELKDHMKQAGTVEFCTVLTQDGTEWGRSKGVGCVRYASEAEAQAAIAQLNETQLQERNIL